MTLALPGDINKLFAFGQINIGRSTKTLRPRLFGASTAQQDADHEHDEHCEFHFTNLWCMVWDTWASFQSHYPT